MIYFVLAISVLGQALQNGAVLELTGEAAKVEFGGALTLIHNSTEDQLVCSGKIQASDVIIEGTTTSVADLIGEVATLRQEMAAVKAFVGMMPRRWQSVGVGCCRIEGGGVTSVMHNAGNDLSLKAPTSTSIALQYMGDNYDLPSCQAACAAISLCNAFEIRGCHLSNAADCYGHCHVFNSGGEPIVAFNCDDLDDQWCYVRP